MSTGNLPDFVQMTRREIEDYLIERAMVEPEFRKQLLENPEQLLRNIGLPVGEDVTIRIFEETPKSFYLVIPRVLQDLEEVADDDLDHVSGGSGSGAGMVQFFRGYE